MTRRQLVRRAALTMFALALGKYDALAQNAGGLTVDLNQWAAITFKYKAETIRIPVAEVFAAIKAGHTP
jgi:hypothetical protein